MFRRFKASLVRWFAVFLLVPAVGTAFVLTELLIQIQLVPDQPYVFDYDNLGVLNTGFTVVNRDQVATNIDIATAYDSELGLEQGENLQDSFVLYDGTLFLDVAASDPEGRANVRTTYRMNVDPRMLEARALRAQFIAQGLTEDQGRAQLWARAAGRADARIMRFSEERVGGRWVRAVRAINDIANADVRFMGRRSPDGVLGHYGYETKQDGTSLVWVVTDTNSKYGVGFTIDRDNDGVTNADDNCPNVANPSQANLDGDFEGDACDNDDDNDFVLDADDNCPVVANPNQEDSDGDGIGNACDAHNDDDDDIDVCESTVEAIFNWLESHNPGLARLLRRLGATQLLIQLCRAYH